MIRDDQPSETESSAAPAAPPYPGGWLTLRAHSDVPRASAQGLDVEIVRNLDERHAWSDPDPVIDILITLPRDVRRDGMPERIDNIPSSLLDVLIEGLTQARDIARYHGMLAASGVDRGKGGSHG